MLTYNQERYIKQAIDSVLKQKTNFNFQLVIGEDCSTDNTRNICAYYAQNFPDKIKLLPALSENKGLIKNYLRTIKECDGKYIAICDGDDYWIDNNKLQKQVDFLENNPEYYIVSTGLKKLYSNGKIRASIQRKTGENYKFEDLVFENFIASVTVLFRNIQISDALPNWIARFPYGDWPTYLWTLKAKGKIYVMQDVTAVYRNDIGVSSKVRNQNSRIVKVNLEIIKCISRDKNFYNKREAIAQSLLKHTKDLVASYNREKKYFKAFSLSLKTVLQSKGSFSLVKFYFYSLKHSFIS